MKKSSTIIVSITIFALIAVIGIGIWVIVSRQNQPVQKEVQQTKTFTADEVAIHKSKDDCWTIISGDVYDLTEFINRHPGGDEILRACGTDGTTLFNSRQTQDGQAVGSGAPHSQAAQEQLAKLKIGTINKN